MIPRMEEVKLISQRHGCGEIQQPDQRERWGRERTNIGKQRQKHTEKRRRLDHLVGREDRRPGRSMESLREIDREDPHVRAVGSESVPSLWGPSVMEDGIM